jgi:hypothetical protein
MYETGAFDYLTAPFTMTTGKVINEAAGNKKSRKQRRLLL